jgi:hypothetical protein
VPDDCEEVPHGIPRYRSRPTDSKTDNDSQLLFDSSSVVDTRRNRVLFFNQIMVSDSAAASYWTALDLATKQVRLRGARTAAQHAARWDAAESACRRSPVCRTTLAVTS